MQKIPEDIRKNRRLYLAEFLVETADLEQTRREWAGQVPGVMRFYSEEVERFLGDWLLGEDLEYAVSIGFLNREEAETLQPFYMAFASFAEANLKADRFAEVTVDDSEWIEISKLAMQASHKLNESLRS